MKKTIIILNIAVLSVFFCSLTITNIFTLNKDLCIEYVMDTLVQIEDNCEDNEFDNTNDTSFRITLQGFLSKTLHPQAILGKLSFVWQPPK
jgi:hypothetical protein